MTQGSTSRSLIQRVQADEADAWRRLVDLYAPLVMHWCRRRLRNEADAADVFQEVFRTAAARITTFRKEQAGDSFRGWLRTVTSSRIVDFVRKRERAPEAIGGSEMKARIAEIPAPAPGTEQFDVGDRTEDLGAAATRAKGSATGDANANDPDTACDADAASAANAAGDDGQAENALDDAGETALVLRSALALIQEQFRPKTWQAFWMTTVDGRPTRDVAEELGMSSGAVRVSKSRVLAKLRGELGDLL